MMTFSPFDKDIEELDEQELQKLIDKSICEGWYIEYKSDLPKKSDKIESIKIVKTISAFANTKGGWLFYGVESDNKNIAINLCGIDLTKYNNLTDQISQIISGNIAPKPIYQFKTVNLKSGKVVFIIKVDESPTPPYYYKSGSNISKGK
jgi:predicted HTH transcriptional regulator